MSTGLFAARSQGPQHGQATLRKVGEGNSIARETWLEAAGYPTTPVDLENEGDMLRSMQAKVTSSNEAMLYFDNALQAKKAAFNNQSRPFFGFNEKEEKRLADVFRKQLKL